MRKLFFELISESDFLVDDEFYLDEARVTDDFKAMACIAMKDVLDNKSRIFRRMISKHIKFELSIQPLNSITKQDYLDLIHDYEHDLSSL